MSTLTDINPADLLVDTNIRTDLNLDTAFTGSIKERGVIVSIVAQATEEGIRVIAGHRRTAAALAAGLPTVPVVIIDTPGEADRIIDQLAENDHRTGLTATDRVNAVHQLALLGVSAAQITKRTKITRDTVDAALSLSGEHRELLPLPQGLADGHAIHACEASCVDFGASVRAVVHDCVVGLLRVSALNGPRD